MQEVTRQALEVLDAYLQEFQPQLTQSLLYQVVRRIIPKLGNEALLEEEVNRLAEQVISEFGLQGVSGKSPDQAAKEIAVQVADEITKFQAEQATLSRVDVTEPEVIGELEVGSRIERTPSSPSGLD